MRPSATRLLSVAASSSPGAGAGSARCTITLAALPCTRSARPQPYDGEARAGRRAWRLDAAAGGSLFRQRWYSTEPSIVSQSGEEAGDASSPSGSNEADNKDRLSDAAAAAAYSATSLANSAAVRKRAGKQKQPSSAKPNAESSAETVAEGSTSSAEARPPPPEEPDLISDPTLTSEELLKRRSVHHQNRAEDLQRIKSVVGDGPETSAGPGAQGSGPEGDLAGLSSELVRVEQNIATSRYSRLIPKVSHPFDTRQFVNRLEAAGFVHQADWMQPRQKRKGKEKERQEGGPAPPGEASSPGTGLQYGHRRDPAQAIMEATRGLLAERNNVMLQRALDKTDLENEAYLFTAALSELRTELQVKARNDAASLRSLTTLLQREVDSLNQKMREDINTLKHDIQVDMNTRKSESKEEQNQLEQDIQDLHNRFTISLSDLKTEIEQNIKWDATRRSLALVFGIAAILMATIMLADFLTRPDPAEEAEKKKREAEAAAQAQLPRKAEELGLVPQYGQDGSRFV